MDKLRQSMDPAERQRLMQEHVATMQSAMGTMHDMMGGPPLTPEQMERRHHMLEEMMSMQQMMMENMLQHQQMMEKK